MNIAAIQKAAELIKAGQLVAMPTETVWGLAANAEDDAAVSKIFATKGRPAHNPLIVHVPSFAAAEKIVEFNEYARIVATLWPGPITMVLKKKPGAKLAKQVTAGLDTVAIRIPAHNIALNLLNQVQVPLAAPSANVSGKMSPTKFAHVSGAFNDESSDELFIIPDDGQSEYGLESTIIDLSGQIPSEGPTILRQGFISQDQLESILGVSVVIANDLSEIKAPGMLLKHYSPNIDVRLNAIAIGEHEVGLDFGSMLIANKFDNPAINLSEKGDIAAAAANLFSALHELDAIASCQGKTAIAVAKIPDHGVGKAINDRLYRAAAK